MISNTSISLSFSYYTAMNPKSKRINFSADCVVKEVVKGSKHKFRHFSMTLLKSMNGVQNMHFFNAC